MKLNIFKICLIFLLAFISFYLPNSASAIYSDGCSPACSREGGSGQCPAAPDGYTGRACAEESCCFNDDGVCQGDWRFCNGDLGYNGTDTIRYWGCPGCGGGGGGGGGTDNPVGAVDISTCGEISGWACDRNGNDATNETNTPIDVHFYMDNSVFIGATTASLTRSDLMGQCGNGATNKAFRFVMPRLIKDGLNHTIYAYGINIGNGSNTLIGSKQIVNADKVPTSCYISIFGHARDTLSRGVNSVSLYGCNIGSKITSESPECPSGGLCFQLLDPGSYRYNNITYGTGFCLRPTLPSGYSSITASNTQYQSKGGYGSNYECQKAGGLFSTCNGWDFDEDSKIDFTLIPNAPAAPSVDTSSVSCLTGDYSGDGVTISWTNPTAKVNWVDIIVGGAYYHKWVSDFETSTTAPNGFNCYSGTCTSGSALTLSYNTTYTAKVYNGALSSGTTFSIPLCSCDTCGSGADACTTTACGTNITGTCNKTVYSGGGTCAADNGASCTTTINCPPTISSLQINNKTPAPSAPSNLKMSGLQVDQNGVGWYNPMVITLGANKGTGDISTYYVAFYNSSTTLSSSIVDTSGNPTPVTNLTNPAGVRLANNDYFVLRYTSTGRFDMWDPNTSSWFNMTGRGAGWSICSTAECTVSNLYYTVYPGDALSDPPELSKARTWTIQLDSRFQSKTLKTAVAVVDTNGLPAFNGNIAPTY